MDNKRIPKEFVDYARACSYTIGTSFKGRTNTHLEKILVSLATMRKQLITKDIIENTLLIDMIESFIDGIRGKKIV